MLGIVVAVAVALVLVVLLVAFPPAGAHRWRHATRPIRRVLRPGHYRPW
jgi:hypothetical protein